MTDVLTPDAEIEEIEVQIDHAKKAVDRLHQLRRLVENEDFRAIITDGYQTEYALRLVDLRADPAQAHPDQQAKLLRELDGIAGLGNYFRTLINQGNTMADAIDHYRAQQAELMAEQERLAAEG